MGGVLTGKDSWGLTHKAPENSVDEPLEWTLAADQTHRLVDGCMRRCAEKQELGGPQTQR